jgi:caffeoyl-CoA O-methyltransferase
MSARAVLPLSVELLDYAVAHSTPQDDVQRRLVERTASFGDWAGMQIGHDQGMFMTLLTRLLNVRNAVEVGTFTGYSSLCIARGLAPGGNLLCCDVSEKWTALARQAWEEAGVTDRVELRIAPALDTLRSLPLDVPIDLVFIDADKPNYIAYYEELLPRLRAGGIILIDNTLWSGNVLNADDDSENTVGIRAINDHVAADDRVEKVILSVGDGLTLIRKK